MSICQQLHGELAALPGVVDVHDLHVWTLTSDMDAASAHLMTADGVDPHGVLDGARSVLADRYGITHGTFQVEPVEPHGLHRSRLVTGPRRAAVGLVSAARVVLP